MKATGIVRRIDDLGRVGELSIFAKEYAESLSQSTGMLSCITDHDQVVAAAGPGSKEFIGKMISHQLEGVINDRESKCLNTKDRGKIPVVDEQPDVSSSQVIHPIIAAGDAIGSVILMGKGDKDIMGTNVKLLVQTAAGFLGRQMEQ